MGLKEREGEERRLRGRRRLRGKAGMRLVRGLGREGRGRTGSASVHDRLDGLGRAREEGRTRGSIAPVDRRVELEGGKRSSRVYQLAAYIASCKGNPNRLAFGPCSRSLRVAGRRRRCTRHALLCLESPSLHDSVSQRSLLQSSPYML